MSDYLDTSLLVASVTPEPAGIQARRWLRANDAEPFAISEWVMTEFAAALSIKQRTGQVSGEQRMSAIEAFARLKQDSLFVEPIAPMHFTLAARFAERHELGLRAGDALHLAVAFTQGHRIVTLDRRMAEAAQHLGIEALMP